MHLVLILPGLLEPSGARTPAPRAPALARLLAAADVPVRESEGLGALVAHHYGIARQTDWPLAALRLATHGVDPGDAYWLAADPVSLVAGRDDVRLAGTVTDLSAIDAQTLLATLDRHFAADALAFVAPSPDAWFVRTPTAPRMTTHSLDGAAGRPLRDLLPEGPDADAWRRWLSEIQMLLHEHPVNVERERQGRTPVSSLWFSGGGTIPARPPRGLAVRTWANAGIATALAMHAGAPAHGLPSEFTAVLRDVASTDRHVVVLNAASDLAAIDAAWAAPAWETLANGTFETVSLITDGAGEALAWTARRPTSLQRLRSRFASHDLAALLAPFRSAS